MLAKVATGAEASEFAAASAAKAAKDRLRALAPLRRNRRWRAALETAPTRIVGPP